MIECSDTVIPQLARTAKRTFYSQHAIFVLSAFELVLLCQLVDTDPHVAIWITSELPTNRELNVFGQD
jgi:hypothetical protein